MTLCKVEIAELTAENWYICCELQVAPYQQAYLEPNAVSIAQSKFEPTLKPYLIYVDGQASGFLMFNSVPEELDGYWIYRIMVDEAFQGKGIGKAATQLMINEMAERFGARKVVVGYHPENRGAHQLYASVGFVDHGDRFGKEMAVVKQLTDA